MKISSYFLALCGLSVSLLAGHPLQAAVSTQPSEGKGADSFTDFEPEGFAISETVHNHAPDGTNPSPPIANIRNCIQAWRIGNSGPTTQDEEVVDLGGIHGKVWRISHGTPTGRRGRAPLSPKMLAVAGESGAANYAGCGAPTVSTFYGQVDFRSVSEAPQPGLLMSVVGQSADRRHAYVLIQDDGSNGLDVGFYDTMGTAPYYTEIASDLAYGSWYTLGIEVFFVDGVDSGTPGVDAVGNDVVNVYLDGTLVHTGTTWESRDSVPQSIDRLGFAGAGSSDPSLIGGGLYYDNVLVTTTCPEGNCSLSPRAQKSEILEDLYALIPTGDHKTDKRIGKAVEKIDKSVDPKYWESEATLTMKGKKVFGEEKKAVHELMKVDPEFIDVSPEILGLTDIDKQLAQIALDQADALAEGAGCYGDEGEPKYCDKALKEIAKASKEMEKGDSEYAEGEYDKAIEHYKKAWDHAQKAMDKVPEEDE